LAFDRCAQETPGLTEHAPGHDAACWLDVLPTPEVPPAAVREVADDVAASEILVIESASLGYGRRTTWRGPRQPVVSDVTLSVAAGRTLGLVGESGSGKSTLVKAIVGLLPLWQGEMTIDGLSWARTTAEERRRLRGTVQMVFQDPYQSLNPRQTLRDTLTEPLVVHGLHAGDREARIRQLMDQVGLSPSYLDRYPYQLSGGQRQRIGIARALAVEPKLVVADEPVSALDVSVQAQIINLLADLRDELGLALLVIAHDLTVVRHLCDEVAVMERGRIVERSETTALFENPGHPYTRALLAASPGSSFAWNEEETA